MTDKQRKLVEDNHNLIYSFLHKYSLDIEEFYDLAAIGLCKAAKSYDSDVSKFSTYAFWCMHNEVMMEVRKEKAGHRIPKSMTYYYQDSFCTKDEDIEYIDTIPNKIHVENEVISKLTMEKLMTQLNNRDRLIFELFSLGYKQVEIAKLAGCSQPQVCRVKKKIENIIRR